MAGQLHQVREGKGVILLKTNPPRSGGEICLQLAFFRGKLVDGREHLVIGEVGCGGPHRRDAGFPVVGSHGARVLLSARAYEPGSRKSLKKAVRRSFERRKSIARSIRSTA